MHSTLKLKTLAHEWHDCQRCKLAKDRPRAEIVFGVGSRHARFLLIYDAPSEGDAALATPFSDTPGQVLLDLLKGAEIHPREIYCTPLVGCRPVTLLPATANAPARLTSRTPEKEEIAACFPRIHQLIYRIDPCVIFAMGELTYKTLVRGKDRDNHNTVEQAVSASELFRTRLPGRWMPELHYDVIPLLPMKKLIDVPSLAEHGPLATNVLHLNRGKIYADFIERTGGRDTRAAGFDLEQTEGPPSEG